MQKIPATIRCAWHTWYAPPLIMSEWISTPGDARKRPTLLDVARREYNEEHSTPSVFRLQHRSKNNTTSILFRRCCRRECPLTGTLSAESQSQFYVTCCRWQPPTTHPQINKTQLPNRKTTSGWHEEHLLSSHDSKWKRACHDKLAQQVNRETKTMPLLSVCGRPNGRSCSGRLSSLHLRWMETEFVPVLS